tara:strand:+ start:983 stop:1186 length:204 start_codon:yes stop_codon:yes gene_type:complete
MERTRHLLKTRNALWVFEPRGDSVEVSETADTGELGTQGSFTKLEARELFKRLRSNGALWREFKVEV